MIQYTHTHAKNMHAKQNICSTSVATKSLLKWRSIELSRKHSILDDEDSISSTKSESNAIVTFHLRRRKKRHSKICIFICIQIDSKINDRVISFTILSEKRNNDREKGVVKTMMNIHSIIRVLNDSTCCAVHSKHVLNAWFRSCCQVEYVCFTRKKMDKKTGNINIYIIVVGNFDSRIPNYILITFQIKKSFITRKPKNA